MTRPRKRPWMPPVRKPTGGDEPAGGPHRPPRATPKPEPARSVFAGRGLFTAHNPGSALHPGSLIDWVALKADGNDRADPAWGPAFMAAGIAVFVWEAQPSEGQAAVARYGAAGYIAQSEGQGQHAAALRVGEDFTGPKALVTNLHADTNPWPPGWYCLPEAYLTVNPQAEPAVVYGDAYARGARDGISPVFEFTEHGVRVPLSRYLELWKDPANWVGYLAEQLDDADVATLRALK